MRRVRKHLKKFTTGLIKHIYFNITHLGYWIFSCHSIILYLKTIPRNKIHLGYTGTMRMVPYITVITANPLAINK